jgi:hypothetical protein
MPANKQTQMKVLSRYIPKGNCIAKSITGFASANSPGQLKSVSVKNPSRIENAKMANMRNVFI